MLLFYFIFFIFFNRTLSQDVYCLLNKVQLTIFKLPQLIGFAVIVQSYNCIGKEKETILIIEVLPENHNHEYLLKLPWVGTKCSSLSPDINLYSEIRWFSFVPHILELDWLSYNLGF